MNEKKHLFFIDDLRIWAIGAVLLQHSATYYIEGSYGNIQVANIFKGITRWNILLFIFVPIPARGTDYQQSHGTPPHAVSY